MSGKGLSATIMEALTYLGTLRADGATAHDLKAGFERVVRDIWPKPAHRTEPWRYECDDCDDTGLIINECRKGQRCPGVSTRTDGARETAGKYRRICATAPESDYTHSYGVPCFCRRGSRFRAPISSGQSFTEATKAKPKPMARWGR